MSYKGGSVCGPMVVYVGGVHYKRDAVAIFGLVTGTPVINSGDGCSTPPIGGVQTDNPWVLNIK